MTAANPITIDLFGWGSACQWCQDEPHDCEECLGWPRCPKRTEVPA